MLLSNTPPGSLEHLSVRLSQGTGKRFPWSYVMNNVGYGPIIVLLLASIASNPCKNINPSLVSYYLVGWFQVT
jgi:hypothetical protein